MTISQKLRLYAHYARKASAVIALGVMLTVATPQPAQAYCSWWGVWICFMVSDPEAEASWGSMAASALAQIGNFVLEQAQWLQENYADAVKTATNTISKLLKTKAEMQTAQAKVDGEVQAQLAKAAGDLAAKAMLSETSEVCALMRMGQSASAAQDASRSAVDSLQTYAAMAGAGAKANTSSPAYAAYLVNDLCQLGLMDTNAAQSRYGALPSNIPCTPPPSPRFIDADMRISSVIDRLQYPLPNKDHVYRTDQGQIVFSGETGQATATEAVPGLGSELDFVAAYKVCENLRLVTATPPNSSGTVSAATISNILADRRLMAARSVPESECLRALGARMSCPAGSINALKDVAGGETCHDKQVKLCKRIKGKREYGGLNMNMASNPLYATALANCEQQGLSMAMYRAISEHRCEDDNYTANLPMKLGGNADKMEMVADRNCHEMQSRYEHYMDNERWGLLMAQSLLDKIAKMPQPGQSSPTVR